MITHEERRKRRLSIAESARELIEQNMRKHEVYSILCARFNVGTSTVDLACKEHQVKFRGYVPKNPQTAISKHELPPKVTEIFEYLKNSDKTYREISELLGVTRQYVQIIHKRLLDDGYDVPLREQVSERKRIVKEQQIKQQDELFAEKYIETNDIQGSADFAQISLKRAQKILRDKKLNGTGLIIDKEICKEFPNQRITRRLGYIIADLFDADIPLNHIAKKWKKPAPFIFNLMAECKNAGIPVPDHVDGRTICEHPLRTPDKICITCGNNFRSFAKLADGTRVRMWSGRQECINCKPFQGRKMNAETKSNTDSNLQESATKEEQEA